MTRLFSFSWSRLALSICAAASLSCSKSNGENGGEAGGNTNGYVYDTAGLQYKSYKGLVMAGYQGWFAAEGDGSQRGWYHYQGNGGFYPGNTNVDFWPDITDYTKRYKSPFQFADGSDAYLYSPYDEESVDLHFKWMKTYGIDGVHMQRFVGEIKSSNP